MTTSRANRFDAARLGAFARRFAAQAAMSATIMTGLHVASLNGVAPADWLFGPKEAADTTDAAPAALPEPVFTADPARKTAGPAIRFVGVPAREAAMPVAPDRTQPTSEGTAASLASFPQPPVSVARPTPRPNPAPAIASPPPATQAVASLEQETPRQARSAHPSARPADVPELVRDAVPFPPDVEDGFRLRDAIPHTGMLAAGAGVIGDTARGALGAAAEGARLVVGY